MNQSENNPVKELGHLTLTGYYAGMPICGADSKTDNDAHAVYAPLALPEYRATRCPACLKAYVDTFDPEELNTAPEWVRELRKTAQPV